MSRPPGLSLQPATNRSGCPSPWTHSLATATGTGGDTQGTEVTGDVVGADSARPTITAGGGVEVAPECTNLQVEVCVCVRACACARVHTHASVPQPLYCLAFLCMYVHVLYPLGAPRQDLDDGDRDRDIERERLGPPHSAPPTGMPYSGPPRMFRGRGRGGPYQPGGEPWGKFSCESCT